MYVYRFPLVPTQPFLSGRGYKQHLYTSEHTWVVISCIKLSSCWSCKRANGRSLVLLRDPAIEDAGRLDPPSSVQPAYLSFSLSSSASSRPSLLRSAHPSSHSSLSLLLLSHLVFDLRSWPDNQHFRGTFKVLPLQLRSTLPESSRMSRIESDIRTRVYAHTHVRTYT